MPASHQTWTVLPHGPLIALAENLMTVTGEVRTPVGTIQRRIMVARLHDAQLVIYSAIALDEPGMAELEAFGTPAFLVVPGYRHRLDAKIWRDRYSTMRVLAPQGARKKVERVVAVYNVGAVFDDDHVMLTDLAGTSAREFALIVTSRDGVTLILNDILFNLPIRPGLTAFFKD